MKWKYVWLLAMTIPGLIVQACSEKRASVQSAADVKEENRPFIMTVKADADDTYTLKLITAAQYDMHLSAEEEAAYHILYDLDCDGDGNYEKPAQTGDVVCELRRGTHQIAVRGTMPGFIFPGAFLYSEESEEGASVGLSALHAVSLDQWGDIPWRNISRLFGCPDITLPPGSERPVYRAQDAPNLQFVRSLECAGSYADYEGDFSSWDVSYITDMRFMFLRATTFNQDLSRWKTGRVTTMGDMFAGAYLFDQPIGLWNTSRVTDMSHMFNGATSFNQDLSSWNTSNVTDMSGMFAGAHLFNQDLSRWDTSRVTSMQRMFAYSDSFDGDLSQWNTTSVKDFSGMFEHTSFDLAKAPKGYSETADR